MGVRLEVSLDERSGEALVYELDQPRIMLGRSQSADVRLPHLAVSATHASLRAQNSGYALYDEGSTNGTFVDESRLAALRAKPLRSGDIIRVGPYTIVVRLGPPVGSATSPLGTSARARALFAREHGDKPRKLVFTNGPREGETITLPSEQAELLLGRAEHADILLDDADCSREHASLVVDDRGVSVADRESKNGVLVNGRVHRERVLRDRDELTIGATVLVFEDPLEPELRALDGLADEPHSQPTKAPPKPVEASAEAPDAAADESTPPIVAIVVEEAQEAKREAKRGGRPFVDRRKSGMTDGLVYMLAGAVLALSLVGIYVLVSAG